MNETNIQGKVVNLHIPSENNKYSWISSVITTVISILVAIGLTWYQINRAEQEEQKAEVERIKTVKNTIVGIVEDHVINNQPISISRLSRLVDIKSREANIKITPRLLEIIQIAELNIINSGYLDFKTKDGYKKVFDSIYSAMRKEYKVNYIDQKNSALIDQLISSIKVGNSEDSISNLQLLVEAYSADIKELEVKSNRKSDLDRLSDLINNKPLYIVGITIAYIIFFIIFFPRLRKIMRASLGNKVSLEEQVGNNVKTEGTMS
jgi:type II secretory pathway pseudopilin PulG